LVSRRPVEWFRNEECYGVDALAGWIGHSAVRAVLERRGVAAETTVMLFAEFLVDQVQVIRFCARVFEVAYRFPDGSEEPSPFDRAGPEHWPLTPAQRAMTDRAVGDFRAVVIFTALALARAGVPLDPQWDGDLAVVGQLLLLPGAGHEIPWDDPPAVLAAKLQAPGISAVFRDGRAVTARDGRSERAAINIDRIRRHVRTQAGGLHLPMPYAHAGTRATPRTVLVRREVLREVLDRFPDITVSRIRQTFDHSAAMPGGHLRVTLAERLGRPASKPSRQTLYSDLAALGRAEG
jgi:hypothetical protein